MTAYDTLEVLVKKRFQPDPDCGIIAQCLARIEELRAMWRLADPVMRRGELQPLWFRGHADADWKLTPKIYRKEFIGSGKPEIRHEIQKPSASVNPGT
jgi:hypothetical protein